MSVTKKVVAIVLGLAIVAISFMLQLLQEQFREWKKQCKKNLTI